MSQADAAKKKTYLMDVVGIRLPLIVLLILFHTFCIYKKDTWPAPYEGFPEIKLYDWLAMLLNNGRLHTMVFISGLLFGYNSIRKPVTGNILPAIWKKAKRILLPCFFFGIFYCLLFHDLSEPWYSLVYRVVKGTGHLWFLPMLFWCYVAAYILTTKFPNISPKKLFAVACLLAIFNPMADVPLQMERLNLFFVYFLLGCSIKQGRLKLPEANRRNLLLAAIMFCVLFLVLMYLRDSWGDLDVKILRILRGFLFNALRLGTALSVIYVIYSIANKPMVTAWLKDKTGLITLSGYCYGVYIYHQFILMALFYKTSLPMAINAWALPWVAFAITLATSLILCHFTLKTKFGRFLIG